MSRQRFVRRIAVLPAAVVLVTALAAPAAAQEAIICLYVNNMWIACI